MKFSAVKRGFALLLTTVLTAGVLLPAFPAAAEEADQPKQAENKVTYTDKDKKDRTVYWSYGIKGPALPEEYQGEGPLTLPLDPKGGWYDMEQKEGDRTDGTAAAVNMLSWWFDVNRDSITAYLDKKPVVSESYKDLVADPQKAKDFLPKPQTQALADSPLYTLFQKKAGKETYAPDSYVDLFLNGYSMNKDRNTPGDFDPKDPETGYFFPVFDMSIMTQRSQDLGTYQELGEELKAWLQHDCAIALSVKQEDGTLRYVNLWGAEFDSQDQLTAIYVTDSGDASGAGKAMVRFAATPAEETQIQLLDLRKKEDPGFTWQNVYTLSSGKNFIDEYQVPVPPQWEEPQYEWSQDRKLCTATREQSNGDMVDYDESVKVESKQTKAPTDKKPGEMTHVATFSADWAEPQTLSEPIPASNTQWGEVQYKWSSDNKTCTAFRVSTEDDSIRQSTDAIAPTSTTKENGKITYVVDFAASDEKWEWAGKTEKTVDAPAEKPTMGQVKYTWSEDNSTCTASAADSSGKEYSAQATVSSETTKKAGCETKGEITYTASFTEDWAKTQTKVQETKALGHDWGEPSYKWSNNNRRCDAVRVCKRDESHKETSTLKEVVARKTKEPTEKEKGETTYTARFHEDWAKTQTMVVADIPVISDNWGKVTYTWSADNRKCTARRVNLDDENRVQEAYAKVSFRITKEATDTERGETTYEARFKELWAKDQTKTVKDVPSLNEDSKNDSLWNEPTYEWSEDFSRCTASRSKKKDPSTVDMAHGRISQEDIKKATCQEPGQILYTATFREPWAKDQKKTVDVQVGPHDLEEVAETPATTGTVGLKAHYRCKLCGKLFLDEKGTQEVQKKDLEIQAPAMAGNNAVVEGIPEKENTVAVVPDSIRKALEDHQEAKGVQITAGNATVVFSRETAEALLKDAGKAKKLVLQVKLTNFSDSGLTSKQAQTAKKNMQSSLYSVSLTDGRKVLEAPCTVMVPYTPVGAGQTQVYVIDEKGGFQKTACQYNSGYLAFNASTGYFMASETELVAEKDGPKIWVILLVIVMVLSFLGFLGIGGYFLYKKFGTDDEDDFSDGPQLDQAARDRIRSGAAAVGAAQGRSPYQPPRQTAPTQQTVYPQQAAPAQQTVYPQQSAHAQQTASPAAPAAQPAAPAQPQPAPGPREPVITPEMAAAAAAGASGAAAYQGTFEKSKPSYAEKAVQAAHHGQKPPVPESTGAEEANSDEELEELKHWLDEIE